MPPPEWLAGNKTIPLDANTRAATVVSGSLAVFASRRGERIYLFSLEAGESLWPVATPEGMAEWELSCIPLEPTCLSGADREPRFALEDWLGKMGEALLRVAPDASAENSIAPEPHRTVELAPGQRIAIERGLVCIRLVSGGGLLKGIEVRESESTVLVPGLCLESSTDAKWQTHESVTPELLEATIRHATLFLFEALRRAKQNHTAEERARFAARMEANSRMEAAALNKVAGLTRRGKSSNAAASTGDPWCDAVFAVGRALGLTLKPAPAAARRYDPTRELAHANGLAREWLP